MVLSAVVAHEPVCGQWKVTVSESAAGSAATVRTTVLAGGLALIATLLAVCTRWPALLATPLPTPVLAAALVVGFFAGEQLLMNVEFRRQAHSLTLAGVPLALGVLIAPLPMVVLARLVGAGLALAVQRISLDKAVYNCASYAFEAAVDALVLHVLLGQAISLNLQTGLVVLTVIALCDQVMSGLVLLVISWHGGSMTRNDVRDVLVPAFLLTVVSTAMAFGVVLFVPIGPLAVGVVAVLALILFIGYRGYLITKRRHQRLELLHEFVNGGVGAESLRDVAEELLARIRTLLRAATAELVLFGAEADVSTGHVVPNLATSGRHEPAADEPQDGRTMRYATHMVDREETGFTVTRENAPSDWVTIRAVNHAEPLLAPRSTKDRAVRHWLDDNRYRDAMVVPLPANSGFVGTLSVSNRLGETATFTPDDLTLLQTLTGHLAVAAGGARLVEQLGYDATHDSLTALANRSYLARQIEQVDTGSTVSACVLLLDLDRFKEVNDGLGHSAGDQLLTVVARRLKAALPDDATVARLGGDEFAALLPTFRGGAEDALVLGRSLATALAQPVVVDEAMLTPDVSVGIALASAATSTGDLLRQADTAMYKAKSNDSTVAIYHPDMDRGRVENLALLADLRVALRESPAEIAVYYQPKLDLATRRVVSAEALVRWNHPKLGILGPDRFIPLAESTGLIDQFTPLILDAALTECRRWMREGHSLSVAINLSARNVGDARLCTRIRDALAHAGVPADKLILEITESSIIADPVQSLTVLRELAELGVTISLDDFGTGYSSLSYLQRLPVKEVKIDRSFVQGLTADDPDPSRALIGSITGLGSKLGLRVVAEGAETIAVIDELHELGCDVVQGYAVARPTPPDAFATWLQHQTFAVPSSTNRSLQLLAN